MHALLYLIVSLLAVAVVFFALGAPFVAALEVIIYAGAIMVLFVFVVMMLNLGARATARSGMAALPAVWIGPAIAWRRSFWANCFTCSGTPRSALPRLARRSGPKQVGVALFGTYLLGVELASMLLLAGLVGAYHLGRRDRRGDEKEERHGHGPA